ncbi:MAG: quinone-dependent dihydroorotate dehydrogenase [Bdellovibrionia bacterium]
MRVWTILPPKWAHDLSPFFLPTIANFYAGPTPVWKSFSWRGMHFANPLGLAGGVDKDARSLQSWYRLGAGFVEVGTVTPLPQGPNQGTILDRDLKLNALWNKMGFPSAGSDVVLKNLQQWQKPFPIPVWINIGKNRQTPNESAVQDYLFNLRHFQAVADAFVVNISSPNTQGLRELQKPENLKKLLLPLTTEAGKFNKPLLLKLSPDMDQSLLTETLLCAVECQVDGFVLTNTTLARTPEMRFPQEGGVSGAPLKEKSLAALQIAQSCLGQKRKDLLLVSCGGILSPEDVTERLHLGADLVEIYSALVLQGPSFFRKVAKCQK